jgi:hypothetical protein
MGRLPPLVLPSVNLHRPLAFRKSTPFARPRPRSSPRRPTPREPSPPRLPLHGSRSILLPNQIPKPRATAPLLLLAAVRLSADDVRAPTVLAGPASVPPCCAARPLHAPGRPDPGPRGRRRVPADQPRRPCAARAGALAARGEPHGGGGAQGAASHADGGSAHGFGSPAPAPCRTPTSCTSAATPPAWTRAPPSRALDESGSVIVLGRTVFLRPDMVRFSPPSPYLYTTAS